eukprot:CAMPEP_0198289818 /NCGR_PEP_ID=MMETSP1449-20131203/7884_1 /TAXON_ID=420275 /ORGANISM="Attheya septentrionalis, Strain CCMP2084" /LENGTH=706 /DNA_ID=CAMNT_0043988211 /DNA_START=248 /DNA_END=2368 /DNA_ORIENTATION=+
MKEFSVRASQSQEMGKDEEVKRGAVGGGIWWKDLGVMQKNGHFLLNPFSGFVENGHVCGIIGPSGSGKSTFLAALGGSTLKQSGLHVSGSVWIVSNDTQTKSSLSISEGEVAMLQQHDAFFAMLTPRETLDMAASLQLNLGKEEISEKVSRVVDSLGLAKVQHRPIGNRQSDGQGHDSGGAGLSGGERRRLSVALELITEPKLFLADEPTTGLDSTQAGKVVSLMNRLAKQNNIPCLLTLHQPRASIWKSLDTLILLAPGGRICYMGTRTEAVTYFDKLGYPCPAETNPAEYFIDLVSVDTEDPEQGAIDNKRIQFLADSFVNHNAESVVQDASDMWAPPPLPRENHRISDVALTHRKMSKTNALYRIRMLFTRSWRQNYRNHRVNAIRIGASVVQALLFSQIFKSVRDGKSIPASIADRTALLSFGVINMSMMALMKTLDLFGREKAVVVREQVRKQYTSFDYLVSKALAEIPLDTFFAAVFSTLLKATTGLRIPLPQLMGTFSLMTVAGASLGFAVGSMTSNVESAMATGMPIMIIFMVVGVINPSGVDLNDPPPFFVQWIKLASPIKWAIEALCVAEFNGMEFGGASQGQPWWRKSIQSFQDLPKMGAFAFVENGNQILEALGLASKTYMGLMKGLAVLSASNLLVSWLGLHFGGNDFVVAVPPDEVETDDLAPEVDLLYESAKKSHPADAGPSERHTSTPRD